MKLKDRGFFLITVLVVFLSVPSLLKSQITITIPNRNGTRGATVEVPVQIQGISVGDSVLAYQMTIWFDSSILQAVGANSQGTMTEFWGETYVGPKTDTVRVGAFTTNEPGTRLVPDAGILVKLEFLVIGEIGTSTQIRIVDKKIFNKDGEMAVANTIDGLLTVTAGSTTTAIDITLHPDWNLVSFPIVADPNTLPDVLGGVPVVFIYGWYSGEGPRTWDESRPPFANDLHMLDGLHGYWMRLNSGQVEILHVSGNTIAVTTPIPLYSGWNLISYLPAATETIVNALQSLNPLYSYIYGFLGGGGGPKTWDRGRPEWANDLTQLSPNFGYWVMMDSARTLVYPSSELLMKETPPIVTHKYQQKMTKTIAPPQYCDFWAFQPGLLTEGDTIRVFDVDGIQCGDTLVVAQGGFLIHVLGDDLSTPDIDEGPMPGEEIYFTIKGDSTRVVGTSTNRDSTIIIGERPIWEYMGSKRVQLERVANSGLVSMLNPVPHEATLLHNYPNPFNARTEISYQVHMPCRVTLHIFDATGRMVRTLVTNQFRIPGRYRVQWDGRNDLGHSVSSGIYICQLQAGKIRYSIKMVLLF